MIDAQSIAVATATLTQLLLDGLPKQDALLSEVDVTSLPPDKVNANVDRATLNVFLYRVATPSALRNNTSVRVGPQHEPDSQSALTLRYLLTAYGRVDEAAGDLSHRVLGAAMRVLDDAPIITEGIADAMVPVHPGLTAPQAMRVIPVDASVEEMSMLWSMFHTSYRLSVVYEIQLHSAPAASKRFSSAVQRLGLHPEASGVMQRLMSELDTAESATNRSALFVGGSGPSVLRAAQLLASTYQRPLHRVDVSKLANTYIGETEKNLSRAFDEAEAAGALLFFDEADALFGKRSDVRDSHDRYANIEVGYLWQRLEAFPGLVVVAAAAKTSLDASFPRRFRFIVDFSKGAKA